MKNRRILWIAAAILVAITAGILITRGPETPTPNPPGSFSFAVLGDSPYYPWEDRQFGLVLQSLDAHDLAWVLHVGDIFWRPCSDALYQRQREWFDGLRHPVIYTPGDNEWTDCWESGSGSFSPRERLERIRQLFFDDPDLSMGQTPLPLVSQARGERFEEFVENVRWSHEGIVFAAVHLVGSMNGLEPFSTRTAADDDEVTRRTEAATAWLRETFAEARASDASAVVVAFHANPDFELPADARYRQAYEPFLAALEEEVMAFHRPVLVTHGDNHEFVVDRPMVDRTTGRRLANLTRMQVPGSSDVGWIRVVVTPGAHDPFAFEPHIVPKWKYW
jgi:hypothetical protein